MPLTRVAEIFRGGLQWRHPELLPHLGRLTVILLLVWAAVLYIAWDDDLDGGRQKL